MNYTEFVSQYCTVDDTHLLWSKEGFFYLVGQRGHIFIALSLIESLNYQSRFDINKYIYNHFQ